MNVYHFKKSKMTVEIEIDRGMWPKDRAGMSINKSNMGEEYEMVNLTLGPR